MSDGWTESAQAWIDDMGENGDFTRHSVLDKPMLARIDARPFRNALDVGCGEGRFSRMLAARGIATIGIDPTEALLAEARRRHPEGDYRPGRAERLDFPDETFDLVVSYLTLIDIPDIEAAIPEMARVLAPGGTLLVANLNGFCTCGGWVTTPEGERVFQLDDYLVERGRWEQWHGIRILNWHRPLSTYMRLFLGSGLTLAHFDEPAPHDGPPDRIRHYIRAPYFHYMEWRKPG